MASPSGSRGRRPDVERFRRLSQVRAAMEGRTSVPPASTWIEQTGELEA